MARLTRRRYFLSLAGCTAALMALVAISPGVGTESKTIRWRDAWRAGLGIPVSGEELTARWHGRAPESVPDTRTDSPASQEVGRPAEAAGQPDLRLFDRDGDGLISDDEAAEFSEVARQIAFGQRLPRTLLALQVGATLALCGATFQVLFRNPLATPYTLGVASGGSLGALVAIRLGWTSVFLGISSLSLAAFGGAVGVVGAIFLLSRGPRSLSSVELLLAGVTMGLFCSAMMMLVTSVSSERETFAVVRWMMGSLDPVTAIRGASLLPLIVPAWVLLILSARALNQYRLGEELAATRGVNTARLQWGCVAICTLAVAGVVATCGPIGFVGLVVPHMAALLFGTDCRILLPASALAGAAFLIVCDWASVGTMRLAGWAVGRELGSATLPIGVVTAIVGVPAFLTLLKTRPR